MSYADTAGLAHVMGKPVRSINNARRLTFEVTYDPQRVSAIALMNVWSHLKGQVNTPGEEDALRVTTTVNAMGHDDVTELLNPTAPCVKRGTSVWSSGHVLEGKTTGGTSRCRLDSCGGYLIHVRWPNGHLTKPCVRGMTLNEDGSWEIQ